MAGTTLASALQPVSARPNIIFCMSDDQGYGQVAYNRIDSKYLTPVLDDMASKGLRLDRYYAASPVCSPTRASIITGGHPYRVKVCHASFPLQFCRTTLPQMMQQNGYRVGHFGKWHLMGRERLDYIIPAGHPLSPGSMGFDTWVSAVNFFDCSEPGPFLSKMGTPVELKGDTSDAVMAEAIQFMKTSTEEGHPFIAFVWFASPHDPYKPLPEYQRLANGNKIAGEVCGVDHSMGTLRNALKAMGVSDNTLLWFMSDNGAPPNRGDNGFLDGGKNGLKEGGLRVPSIIEWPSVIKEPGVCTVPIVSTDLYATLADLVGGKMPEWGGTHDGMSVLPIIKGELTSRPQPIAFWHDKESFGKNYNDGVDETRETNERALVDNRYKIYCKGAGAYELYDVVDDPGEKNNIAGAFPEITEKMVQKLEAWQASVRIGLDANKLLIRTEK